MRERGTQQTRRSVRVAGVRVAGVHVAGVRVAGSERAQQKVGLHKAGAGILWATNSSPHAPNQRLLLTTEDRVSYKLRERQRGPGKRCSITGHVHEIQPALCSAA